MSLFRAHRWLLLSCLAFGLLTACEDDDDDDDRYARAAPEAVDLRQTLEGHAWYVSFFSEYGRDETDDFRPYTLFFEEDGRLRVTDGDQTAAQGNWYTEFDDGEVELYILLSEPASVLDELDDDWHLRGQTADELRFEEEKDDEYEESREQLHLHRLAE